MELRRSVHFWITGIALIMLLSNVNGEKENLKVMWRLDNDYMTLNLHENDHVTSRAPVLISRNGVISTWSSTNSKDFKAYVDPENKAAILVEGSEDGRKSYRGTFKKGEEEFVLNPITRESSRSKRDADGDVIVDLGDVTSMVSIGTNEIPESYLINDTLGGEDAMSLQSNQISSLPIDTGRKMYYGVETVIFVDYAIYNRWYELAEGYTPMEKEDNAISNIRFYFSHVANGLDLRYNGIDEPDFEIYIILNGIFIAMGPEDSPFVEQHTSYSGPEPYVDGPTALPTFEEWLDNNKDILPPYDQASLFIGNQMVQYYNGERSELLGFAHVTGMCSYYSASISLDHGYYGSVLIAAHEMGHNLGAFHDGDDRQPDSAPCSPKDQYVMAAYLGSTTDQTFYNPFSFSTCSVVQFRKFMNVLNLDNNNCLLTSAGPTDGNDLDRHLNEKPGQRFTPDQQCQHMYGSRSYHCAGGGAGASICREMHCYNLIEEKCKSESNMRGADGTTCGNKMWCIGGDCVYDERAPEASDECTFGDYKGQLSSGQTCAEMVHDSPWLCYRDPESQKCCGSCARIADDNDQECRYGDKAEWCRDIKARDCYRDDVETTCCRTCAAYKISQKGCEYGNYDGDLCSNLPVRKCYAHEKTCCAFCPGVKSDNKDCPYGDKTEWCPDYISSSPHECYRDNITCCESCARHRTNVKGCEYGDKQASCESWMCDDPYYQQQGLCCATCSQLTPTTTTTTTTTMTKTTISPSTSTTEPVSDCTDKAAWCMDYITSDPGICYDDRTNRLCCNACKTQRTSNPNCLYGDMYWGCQLYHCATNAKECCVTCGLQMYGSDFSDLSGNS